MKHTAWVALATLVLVACQEQGPTQPTDDAAFTISDGVAGGNPDFFFLPPLVPNPKLHPDFDEGEFNFDLAPRWKSVKSTTRSKRARQRRDQVFRSSFRLAALG